MATSLLAHNDRAIVSGVGEISGGGEENVGGHRRAEEERHATPGEDRTQACIERKPVLAKPRLKTIAA